MPVCTIKKLSYYFTYIVSIQFTDIWLLFIVTTQSYENDIMNALFKRLMHNKESENDFNIKSLV